MKNMYDKNNNYKFLPKEFRDFHNQKDLVRDIYKQVDYPKLEMDDYYKIGSVTFHINMVDIFLYQMALRGYTLQRDKRFVTSSKSIKQIEKDKNGKRDME